MKFIAKIIKNQDAASGAFLISAAVLAMIFANTSMKEFYNGVLSLVVVVGAGDFEISKPLFLWVNDGLMALFFLHVGLEIKREFLQGHLSHVSQTVLPGIAAMAGVVCPALIYVALNYNDATALRGWAIPSATDIAFALGVFSIFGQHLSVSLKLFLLSVAIFDDIAAIVIIALFYSNELSEFSLLLAFVGIACLFILNRFGSRYLSFYMLIGIIVWAAVLKSGVHATLAGFLLAWFIPTKVNNLSNYPMASALEKGLHPWVAFFILPFFAFVNAGVNLNGLGFDVLFAPVTLGIIGGLFIGKQLGIVTVCWLAIKMKIASLPKGASWREFYGVSLLAGIGFTMSLFIGSLAFETEGQELAEKVKLGVLVGSLLSAIVGALVITSTRRKDEKIN
ncbi:Na(+)/H(+) antiporter NhaA [Zhongshania aliphaticivorans]|uniref:Na(+)/H(+) antiporter NhaA n=1 Tax=Zhongshania aliphaticivorans TaxID=1470434 RepID=A0A5S9PHS0_9GAMM|nr:Na+/H+ antiporter NhaA [Zhongshania aliphaticivorans]CAA0103699.1 Na(+)/H(+) antiporter NhaA [Zhongshania aliphaticivorans]CAA0113327.1 Na(+)/H(+) antiporter NhaA [Zhongshania aliphaticivorans]